MQSLTYKLSSIYVGVTYNFVTKNDESLIINVYLHDGKRVK